MTADIAPSPDARNPGERAHGDRARDSRTDCDDVPVAESRTRQLGGLPLWVLIAIVAAGLLLRIYVLQSPLGGMDADEATSALVSQQILDGKFPAFIGPLHHGGSLLAYPRAPFLAIFGPNVAVMKLVEVAVYAAACVMTWRVGRRIFNERAAQLGAAVMWVYPPASVWESTKVMLYYTPALLFVVCTLLVCVRLYQNPERTSDLWWLGLLGGLSIWTHPFALYATVPAIGWLFWNRRGLWRNAWRAIPTGILGGLPWLWANAHNGWASLEQPPGPAPSTYSERLTGFFVELLPRMTGLRHQYFGGWYLSPLSGLAYLALFGAAIFAIRHWKREATLLLTVGIAYPILFSIPKNSVFVAEPRYGMALIPVLALCVGYALSRVLRPPLLAAAAIGVLAVVSAVSLRYIVVDSAEHPERYGVMRPAPIDELWPLIAERDIESAYADYWVGMRLQFEQREPFTLLPINSYYLDYLRDAPPEGSRYAIFSLGSPLIDRWVELVAQQGRSIDFRSTETYMLVITDEPVPFATTIGVLDS